MAFGRSNSLSINTSAANTGPSLFGSSTTNTNNSAGNLFGGGAGTNTQAQPSGGLFGSTQPTTTTAGGGLFGNTQATTTNTTGGGLFGNMANSNNTNQSSGAGAGGLFGGGGTQTNNQTGGGLFGNTSNTSQTTGGGLFGGANSTTTNQNQNTGGGLFGGGNNTANQSGGGGLFGASTAAPAQTGGLFGAANTNNNNTGSSIFGGDPTGASSLFGGKGPTGNTSSMAGNSFNASQSQQQAQQRAQHLSATSAFGMNGIPPEHLNRSMLGASQFRQAPNIPGSFAGRLTMGQTSNAAPAQNIATVGGTKVTLDELRSTTRFQDLHDDLKAEFEKANKMIQAQESFCAQTQAMMPKHGQEVLSIAPDVELVKEKADAVEQLLSSDAQGVDLCRRTAEKDREDFERCQRIIENLALPERFHATNPAAGGYGGLYASQARLAHPAMSAAERSAEDSYDTDMIGNYFSPLASELQRTLHTYANNLQEIEQHMRIMEHSAVAQAQQLVASRAGVSVANGRRPSEEDTVRDLAETLQGFEQSILSVAGVVGQCREGVNQLVLGQLGASASGPSEERSRRPW